MVRNTFCVVNEERLRVKCHYIRAIYESRHKFESCRKQKFAYKLANNDSKGFWHGRKSLKGKKNLDISHYITGCQNKDAVC